MCAVPSSRVELSFFGTVLGRDAGTDSKFGWSSSSVHHHHNHSIPMPLSPSRWCTGCWAQPGSLALIVCSACFSCTRYSSNTPPGPHAPTHVFTWMGRWPFGTNKAHLDQMAFVGTWSSGWVDVHLEPQMFSWMVVGCPLWWLDAHLDQMAFDGRSSFIARLRPPGWSTSTQSRDQAAPVGDAHHPPFPEP